MHRHELFAAVLVVAATAVSADAQSSQQLQVRLASPPQMPVAVEQVLPTEVSDQSVNGAVDLEVVVDAAGQVAHARVVTGLTARVDQVCLEAARLWQFRPSVRAGTPIATLIGLRFGFNPQGTPHVTAMVSALPSEPLPDRPDLVAPRSPTGPGGLRAVRMVTPTYSDAAMRQKIQGSVELHVVVLADGSVGSTRVTRSLDPLLDEEALIAARYWLFAPATVDGRPVMASATLLLDFRLK